MARRLFLPSAPPLGEPGSGAEVAPGTRSTGAQGSDPHPRRMRIGIFSAGDSSGGSSRDLADLHELARESGICVAGAVDGSTEQAGAQQDLSDVPGGAKAYVVPLEIGSVHAAGHAFRQLDQRRRGEETFKPIFAVLLGGRQLYYDLQRLLKAQRDLMNMGFDDVIAKLGGKAEIKLELSMSLVRAKAKQAKLAEAKAKLAEKIKEEKVRAERRNDLFWEVAHKVFQHFPRLQEDLPLDVGVGCVVGPCRLNGLLGRGSFAVVYSATNCETGEREAVKAVDKAQLEDVSEVAQLWREMEVLKGLEHPKIVAFLGASQGPGHIFLRMENVGCKNLWQGMKMSGGTLSLELSQSFTAQLAMALQHSFSRGVAHRDVKPENVVISDCGSVVKLVDWGSAALLDGPRKDMAGTMPFMAPEVLLAEDQNPYDPSGMDVWALGVVVLEMLCGIGTLSTMLRWGESAKPTKQRGADLEAFFSKSGGAVTDEITQALEEATQELVVLLDGMLRVDLETRLTAAQVLESPWLRGFQ